MAFAEEVEELRRLVADLSAHLDRRCTPMPPAPPAANAPSRSPNVPLPSFFDGSDVDTFLREIALYATVRPDNFQNDIQKISWALAFFCGGAAGPWVHAAMQAITDAAPTPDYLLTFNAFVQRLQADFGDPDARSTAQHKIAHLRQGNRPVIDYIFEFQALARAMEYNNIALVDRFKGGLNDCLLDSVYRVERLPSTLKEWEEIAGRLDKQWRQ
jgi:hypothetical protein